MQWPEITDADLNAFVDLELDAYDLMRVTVDLLAEPEAARRVGAYARQRGTLAALRAEMDAHRSNRRLEHLEDELCQLMRQQTEKGMAWSPWAMAQPTSPGRPLPRPW